LTQDHQGSAAGTTLWWCDGPCGAAKAALTAQSKESMLRAVDLPADAKQTVAVIRQVAWRAEGGSAAAAVLAVENAAAVMVFANRCPSVRAVVGTCSGGGRTGHPAGGGQRARHRAPAQDAAAGQEHARAGSPERSAS
jgi:hypothetical protein